MIWSLLGTAILLTTAFCQTFPPDIEDDLQNISNNIRVIFHDCSTTKVLPSNLQFVLHTREAKANGIILNSTDYTKVNPQNRLIVIIHGWLQSHQQSWITEMKDVYLKKEPANVLLVDWSYYAGINYAASVCAVGPVGNIVGNLIYNLTVSNRTTLNQTQITGFSLGAHVGGIAGQEIQAKTGGKKLARINGLEAAGPGFLEAPLDQRLDAGDANFVQGIHTNAYQLGYGPSYATVDFYVNYKFLWGCGTKQPGCPLNPGVPQDNSISLSSIFPYVFCNHVRAAVYFIESINSDEFIGTKCSGCGSFALGFCHSSPKTIMGESCPSTVKGDYYLNTNSKSPFAKGSAGA